MADSGFLIDGTQYEVPTLDSFTMDEAEILYKCSGLTLEDFAVDEDDPEASAELQRNIRNPGFIRSLMIVSYIRGNAGISETKAAAVIGKANVLDALKSFVEAQVGDADPPEVKPSENGSDVVAESSASSNDPSGGTSTEGSGEPEEIPVVTGTSA